MPTVVLPPIVSIPIPGCKDLVITRDDITSKEAWYKLSIKHDPYLGVQDFFDYDLFTKYFLVSLGLLEYPMVLICGAEGEGKSLILAWIGYKLSQLFDKRCTLDWTPPNPKLFGKYFDFYDDDFTEKIQHELNRLNKITREEQREPTAEELEELIIYNTAFCLDEGDSYGDKSSRTNLTKLIGRIIRRRRHFHTCFFMAFVDPDDADYRMIYSRRTHEISCGREWFYKDTCSYLINNKRNGIHKYLHLKPAECTDLWRTHNIVEISHNIDIYLGGHKAKAKAKANGEDKW